MWMLQLRQIMHEVMLHDSGAPRRMLLARLRCAGVLAFAGKPRDEIDVRLRPRVSRLANQVDSRHEGLLLRGISARLQHFGRSRTVLQELRHVAGVLVIRQEEVLLQCLRQGLRDERTGAAPHNGHGNLKLQVAAALHSSRGKLNL